MEIYQPDKFIINCIPISKNVEFLAKTLIHIKKKDANLIHFQSCYNLVYNWCKLHSVKELKLVRINIINYIINNLVIIEDKNIEMLSAVFVYFNNFEPTWCNLLIKVNLIVIKRRKKIKQILNNFTIQNNISNDTLNIINQYI